MKTAVMFGVQTDPTPPIWREVVRTAACTAATMVVTKLVEHFYERWKANRERNEGGGR